MKSFWRKKIIICAIFVAASIVCEVATFIWMGFGFLPNYFLIDFSILLVIAGLVLLVPNHILSVLLYSMFFAFQCTLSTTNVIMYRILGDVFTMDLLTLTGEAREMASVGVLNFWPIFTFGAIFVLFLASQIFVLIKVKSDGFIYGKKNALALATVFIVSCVVSPFSVVIQGNILPNDGHKTVFGISTKQNFDDIAFKVNFFKSFGTFSLAYKNILMGTTPGKVFSYRTDEEAIKYFSEPADVYKNSYGEVGESPDAGNNLIVIMMESLDSFFINEKYTPDIYNLMHGGINFTNYHAHAKTDVSEATVILGNYPMSENLILDWYNGGGKGDSRKGKFAREFPFSLPNLLRDNGYKHNNYYICHNGDYYGREYTHTDYGFDNAYFVEDFLHNDNFDDYEDFVRSWKMPESYFLNSAINDPDEEKKFIPSDWKTEKFFSFFTTINPHMPYTNKLTGKLEKEFYNIIKDDSFEELNLNSSELKLYKNGLARAMVANDGIKYLLEELGCREFSDGSTLLDRTTIMIYADHNAYGNNLAYKVKNTKKTDSRSFNIPAFISSPNVGSLECDKFITTVDLVPTLLDLLGIDDYNPRMYLGKNAFYQSDNEIDENIVFSRLGIVFNDKYCTDGMYVTYSAVGTTSDDLLAFKNKYVDMIDRWSYINRLFFRGNEVFFLADG